MYNWCLDYGMIITLQIWDSVSLSHQRSSCILCSSHLWSWKKSWLLSSSGVINEGKNHPQLLWSKIFQHLHIWDFNFDLVFHGFLSSDCIHFSKCSHSKISRGACTCLSDGFLNVCFRVTEVLPIPSCVARDWLPLRFLHATP